VPVKRLAVSAPVLAHFDGGSAAASVLERPLRPPRLAAHPAHVPASYAEPLRQPLSKTRGAERVRDGTSGRLLVLGGRALLVWLSVYAFTIRADSTRVEFVFASAILCGIWLSGLTAALRALPYSLGPAAACAAGAAIGLVGAGFVDPWLPGLQLGVLQIALMAGSVFAFTWAWEVAVRRARVAATRVLVVGPPEFAAMIAEEIERSPASPFELLGAVSRRPNRNAGKTYLLGGMPSLGAIVESLRPDLVVLADPKSYAPALDRLLDVGDKRLRVISYASFFEHAFGRVPVKQLSSAWFMSVLHLRQQAYSGVAKRSFDIAMALIGCALAAPFMLLIAPLVRVSGPVFHRQVRLGERGRPFEMLKFRTMVRDAEADGVARWAAAGDPRITRVGRVLRRAHLDELPQLWNVLRGEMSIVGPRPERPEFLEAIANEVPHWSRRLMVKPGITGWAQVRSGYAADLEAAADKLSYDLWYLRNRNLLIDLAVCGRTFSRLFADSRSH
jgi:exopolysaccharide biosynthesis polyprenyl glycosylphosphotransferase